MTDTLLIAVIVSLVVLVAIVAWYLIKNKQVAKPEAPTMEPSMTPVVEKTAEAVDMGDVDEDGEAVKLTAWVQGVKPGKEPPIYEHIQKEREQQAKLRQKGDGAPIFGAEGLASIPIDPIVQWKLSVEGDQKHPISVGQISLLCDLFDRELEDIPYEAWAQSLTDNLYYPLRVVSTPVREVVVGVSYANRRYLLTEDKAGRIHSVVETLASQEYAPLELSVELGEVENTAKRVQAYVKYFQNYYRVILAPRQEPIAEATVYMEVPHANMKPLGDGFGYWTNPFMRDPAFILLPLEGKPGYWEMIFDAQLANIKRGEFKRFFAVVNHVASLLGARCLTESGRPLSAAEILQQEARLMESQEKMASLNIQPGSTRAYKLFANYF